MGDYVNGYLRAGGWGNVYDASGHEIKLFRSAPRLERRSSCTTTGSNAGALGEGGIDSRWIPYVQAGASTELERAFDLDWKYIDKLKHTIEPFVTYQYTPAISQSAVPLWDQDDRINPRSLIVYGFTSRLYARMNSAAGPSEIPESAEAESGAVQAAGAEQSGENPYGGSSDNFYGDNTPLESHGNGVTTRELASLTVMQAYDTNHPVAGSDIGLSDIQGTFTLLPTSIVSFGSQVGYDPRSHPGISYASVNLSLQPPWTENRAPLYLGRALQGSFVELSYNYVRPQNAVQSGTSGNGSGFVALRSYYDILDRMGVYFAPSYDVSASRMLSTEYGVRLKSPCDCWAFDVGITDSYNPNEVQVQVQLTLGGLGSFGQTPFGRNPFASMGLAGGPVGVLPSY